MPALDPAGVESLRREVDRITEVATAKLHDDEVRLRALREARGLLAEAAGDRVYKLDEVIDRDQDRHHGATELQRLFSGEWRQFFERNAPLADQLDENAWVAQGRRDMALITSAETATQSAAEYVSQTIIDSAPDRATIDPPFASPAQLDEAADEALHGPHGFRPPDEELRPHIVMPPEEP